MCVQCIAWRLQWISFTIGPNSRFCSRILSNSWSESKPGVDSEAKLCHSVAFSPTHWAGERVANALSLSLFKDVALGTVRNPALYPRRHQPQLSLWIPSPQKQKPERRVSDFQLEHRFGTWRAGEISPGWHLNKPRLLLLLAFLNRRSSFFK